MSSSEPERVVLRHQVAACPTGAVRTHLPTQVVERVRVPEPVRLDLEVAPLVQAVQAGVQQIRAQHEALLQEIERECVELVFAAASSITRQEIDRGQYDLSSVLQEVLDANRQMLRGERVTLRVHPDDAAALRTGLPEPATDGTEFDLTEDPRLARGSLELQFGATRLARSLETELQRLRQQFTPGGRS